MKLVATMLLQRLRLELLPGRTMTIRQMPTLSPDGGLAMRVRERELPEPLALSRDRRERVVLSSALALPIKTVDKGGNQRC